METTLALGAQLDIATGNELRDGVGSILSAMDNNKSRLPIYQTLTGTAQGTTITENVDLGSPGTGHMWNILGYSVCAQNETIVPATGSAHLYKGNPSNPSLGGLLIPNLSIYGWNTISKNAMWIQDGENLFFKLVAVTGNGLTQFTGNVHVAIWKTCDVAARNLR